MSGWRLIRAFLVTHTATTETSTLSLHDALPIFGGGTPSLMAPQTAGAILDAIARHWPIAPDVEDRKSTRLNSSHANISYAVFCLKKKNYRGQQPTAMHNMSKSTTLHG